MKLYNLVVKNLKDDEETMSNQHSSKISMLDEKMAEDVYLLILHHYVTNKKINKEKLLEGTETPYLSKPISKNGKGLTFKIGNIPLDLQKIIVCYLRMISK